MLLDIPEEQANSYYGKNYLQKYSQDAEKAIDEAFKKGKAEGYNDACLTVKVMEKKAILQAKVDELEQILLDTDYIPCTYSDTKIKKWRNIGIKNG